MTRMLSVVGLCLAIGGPVSAQTPATAAPGVVTRSAIPAVSGRAGGPAVLPGTRETAFSTIQVSARDSTNGILPDTAVRLRDARLGRIVGTRLTDKSGMFVFRAVDPGSYIVELLDSADNVLAASQLINVNAGDTISVVVKLPFRLPVLGGLFGHTTAQAVAIISAAAATGVLNAATTTDVSSDGTN